MQGLQFILNFENIQFFVCSGFTFVIDYDDDHHHHNHFLLFRLHGLKNCSFYPYSDLPLIVVIFWLVTPCFLVGGYRHFGGTYRLHLQGEDLADDYQHFGGIYHYPEDGSNTFLQSLLTTYKITRHHNPEDLHRHFTALRTSDLILRVS
jgi:hypothetical protein